MATRLLTEQEIERNKRFGDMQAREMGFPDPDSHILCEEYRGPFFEMVITGKSVILSTGDHCCHCGSSWGPNRPQRSASPAQ